MLYFDDEVLMEYVPMQNEIVDGEWDERTESYWILMQPYDYEEDNIISLS